MVVLLAKRICTDQRAIGRLPPPPHELDASDYPYCGGRDVVKLATGELCC
jgi:hypothetical protein